jgi:predicted RNA-binding protein with PUA-like domain
MNKKFWLIKSEPEVFSISDLGKSKDKTTYWDGVRNYQARNYLRDEMKKGDGVLFYHSNTEPPAVAGICRVVKEGYPDFTAFDSANIHYDPKSSPDKPVWFMVDVKLVKAFRNTVPLADLRKNELLSNMKLLQKGNRLSVMPIAEEEFAEICRMAGEKI